VSHASSGHDRNLVPGSGLFGRIRAGETARFRGPEGSSGHGRNLVPGMSQGAMAA
jgi:hypothetical protein